MEGPIDNIITEVIEAEGGDKVTNRPTDSGGRTQFGISEKHNPEAWEDGKVTEQEARDIYFKKYVSTPGFDKVTPTRLQHQLVDFGVLSGSQIATTKLQEILEVEADGILGPETLGALSERDWVQVNNKLVVARVKLFGRLVQRRPKDLEYLSGWLNRALEFLVI
jgi:lysozyme family protein